MTIDSVFNDLHREIHDHYQPLNDKPEETPESTLRALWFLAAGDCRAVERCDEDPLPPLSDTAREHLEDMVRQRLGGVPLAHLIGRQSFMGVEMLAGPEALIPRKETEILGYAALDALKEVVAARGEATVIDLCTGCGNLALALAHHEPKCRVFAADLSAEAVGLAERNTRFLGLNDRVTFHVGDLFAPFDHERFRRRVDMVVCNPPYISSKRVAQMPEEIRVHEPHMAFDGGPFGVSIIFRLIKEAPRYLKPDAWLGFEVGLGQGEPVVKRLSNSEHFYAVTPYTDPDGTVRALMARRR